MILSGGRERLEANPFWTGLRALNSVDFQTQLEQLVQSILDAIDVLGGRLAEDERRKLAVMLRIAARDFDYVVEGLYFVQHVLEQRIEEDLVVTAREQARPRGESEAENATYARMSLDYLRLVATGRKALSPAIIAFWHDYLDETDPRLCRAKVELLAFALRAVLAEPEHYAGPRPRILLAPRNGERPFHERAELAERPDWPVLFLLLFEPGDPEKPEQPHVPTPDRRAAVESWRERDLRLPGIPPERSRELLERAAEFWEERARR